MFQYELNRIIKESSRACDWGGEVGWGCIDRLFIIHEEERERACKLSWLSKQEFWVKVWMHNKEREGQGETWEGQELFVLSSNEITWQFRFLIQTHTQTHIPMQVASNIILVSLLICCIVTRWRLSQCVCCVSDRTGLASGTRVRAAWYSECARTHTHTE